MSKGPWRRRRAAIAAPWQPPEGWTERASGVWAPSEYQPSSWEIQAPEVRTPEDAEREYARCSKHLDYFALVHCWSVDVDHPSGTPTWGKFPAYPYLRRFFQAVQIPSNTHVEKSRQMLMSWAWMAVFLWDISFHETWNNLLISRRETDVDDGGELSTVNSLIGKIRHLWMALPPYLQQPFDFRKGIIRHEAAGSFVKGETGTIKAGRGGAAKRALVDEAALIEKGETVFASVRQVAKTGTILNSTPRGKTNVFARIRFSTTTTFRKFSFHWTEHPRKVEGLYCTCGWTSDGTSPVALRDQFLTHACGNPGETPPKLPEPRSPWYDNECRDLTPEQIAEELDISYEKSARGRVFPAFDVVRLVKEHQVLVSERARTELVKEYRERYLRKVLLPWKPCVVGWDFGVSDPTSLILGQVLDEATMHIRWVDEFETNEQSWDFYHKFVNGLWAPLIKEVTHLDLVHYCDPSGENRQSDLMSWVANLASRQPRIVMVTGPKTASPLAWLDEINRRMRDNQFEIMTWCAHMIEGCGQYHFPLDKNGEPVPGEHMPVHDQWSHAMSAMRYVYMFRWPGRVRDVDQVAVTSSKILSDEATEVESAPPGGTKIF